MTVVFVDAEAILCGYLEDRVGVPVQTEVPNPRPASFVRVIRTGGPRLNQVADNPQLTIEGWAATETAAHDLLQLARSHVHGLAGTVQGDVAIYRVNEFAGPANFPDPETGQARYSFTVQIAMRGRTL